MKKAILLLLLGMTVQAQLYQAPVYTVTSFQTSQPGADTAFAIDNNNNTIYHSAWDVNGIPDELNFYFTQQVPSIKQIVYTPRVSGLNGVWTNVSVSYSTQQNPGNFIPIATNLIWIANNQDKIITLPNAILNPAVVKFIAHAAVNNFSSCNEMRFYSEQQMPVNVQDCTVITSELQMDTKATIMETGSYASSFQTGADINLSFDNNLATIYHSTWTNTQFPVTLNYRLNGITAIDYLKYIPRPIGNSNGNFGTITVKYNTVSNSTFQTLMNFDCQQSEMPVKVDFPNQITPLNIQVIVNSGYGNFASCAEMEFYTHVSSSPYPGIFTNVLCSALLPGVTQTTINTITSPFYKSLAQCLFSGTYNHRYRVQQYKVYPTTASISTTLKVGTYDLFENATGIVFNQDSKIALFASNIPQNVPVYLKVKDFATSMDAVESTYQLQNGLNVFIVSNSGLGYISYYNNNPLNNVEINIASGLVNGYFDSETSTNADWIELLTNTNYPKLDVRGEFIHLVYDKDTFRSGTPFDGLGLIGVYDTIIRHQRLLMGLFKYNKSPKNHQFAYSDHLDGWYAGGLGVHFDVDWGINSIANANGLDLWGVPHEFGHINQIRPDLEWHGLTEVTNNVYSLWVYYNMNTQQERFTRLESDTVEPAANIPAIAGGRINGSIYATHVNGDALQGVNNDVFRILVPFWQLELYYQLAGAAKNAPTLSFTDPQNYIGVDYAHWYGTVAEISRNTNSTGLTNGQLLLNFVKNTCEAVQQDLTQFFQNTGFLKPINRTFDDYGTGQVVVTQAQIDATIAYIQSQHYEQPVSPVINYISAHSIDAYKYQLPLSGQTGVGVTLNNNSLLIQHSEWHNAVAYETFDASNHLIYVTVSGTGDTSNQTTTVYYPANALKVYAVGFDGQRILVYPTSLTVDTLTFDSISVYPNPVKNVIHIKLSDSLDITSVSASIYDLNERLVFSVLDFSQPINVEKLAAGTYILSVTDTKNKTYSQKFVKE